MHTFSKDIQLETALMVITCIYYNIEETEALIETFE